MKAGRQDGPVRLPGWERLRHGGLLLDGARLAALARPVPGPLDAWTERQLRRRAGAMLDGGGEASPFAAFVLEHVCGFDAATGAWTRGNHVAPAWGRRAVTGETVKPGQLWEGRGGGRLPVFLDDGRRLGIGKSRRVVSRVLGWLRAGGDHLALVTNGRQWRLVFAGLDYDAWCEWDLDLWFEEGELSPQVTALRALLRPALWTPGADDAEPPLLRAIRDTRKGQAELSEALGERVREAVEILIRAHGDALRVLVEAPSGSEGIQEYVEYLADDAGVPAPDADEIEELFGATHADIYRAACRVAMRLVVILFAESRDLLPRDNTLYHESYGLHGLLERLERAAARGGGLAGSFGAWPRILALFALVREGSHHPDLPVTAYGGDLFAPGAPDAGDGVSRALHVYEHACFEHPVLPDRDVHEMLKLLTRTTIRIRQGRAGVRAAAPVDFSDLSSEYIGILYEGLLDYELKTAPAGDPVIFLAVGDQPALPLSRLEAMDDRALRALFERLKEKPGTTGDASEEEGTETESPDQDQDTDDDADRHVRADVRDAPPADPEDAAPEHVTAAPDERQRNRTRAEAWARRAVRAAGLLGKPRGRDTPERRLAFDERLGAKARQLVARVVLPGEWYLVRWGGTRKGSGSFYTRPGLAVPTVQRTLRPLAYDPPAGGDGKPDADAPPARWTPKSPERILDLTVCDPACGSGTFPLAALRFLTDALYAALQHHGRLEPDGDRVLVRLLGIRDASAAAGDDESGRTGSSRGAGGGESRLADELIPCRPDDDRFEPRLRAVLRRHVVERCIYAVDLDPLAVELCRLSLWIETMDRTLPFGFLDHKIKCGNALIGAWCDQFRHYPAMAWKNREGGDRNHANGVHFAKNARTQAIKRFVKERLTPDLKRFLGGATLFQADLLERTAAAHDGALAVLERMHAMPVHDAAERARLYRDELVGSAAWRALKEAMDLWCACWFWPADAIEHAPLPSAFAAPPDVTRTVARRIAAEMRFFHWELEFPDVFRESLQRGSAIAERASGFDAMLGNPPWDIAKPVSREFFSNLDPLYRSYGKQEALDRQSACFADAAVERDWLDYNARFRAQSNFTSHAASPFGDPEENAASQDRFVVVRGRGNLDVHDRWRRARDRAAGFCDPAHPFRHQGAADLNLYKLFLEAAHALLKQPRSRIDGEQPANAGRRGGRLGFIVPSGLYSDNGTGALRDLFLERCRWEWLFGVENRDKIFPIHRSYKFNPVIVEKGGATAAIRTAFMRRDLDDWERADDFATSYTLAQIKQFSPKSRAILEIQSQRDLEILEKIYANAVLLGDDGPGGWDLRYATEFHMTNDSRLFPPRPRWEAKGYRPDEYSRWLLGDWRPIDELWVEMGVDPSRPVPAEIEIEEWLFDTTAGPERREAEARFVHGHRLKPGDVARTEWRSRGAELPYDRLPISRANLPPGVILSRDGDAWVRESAVNEVALPLYQGIMVQPFMPSARGWISGTGLRATWNYNDPVNLRWNPQYLMDHAMAEGGMQTSAGAKIGYREVARSTDARSFIGAVLPAFPCGHKVPVLALRSNRPISRTILAVALMNSVTFDWLIRERLGAAALAWYVLAEAALPNEVAAASASILVVRLVSQLNLFPRVFAPIRMFAAEPYVLHNALHPGERKRLRVTVDAIAALMFGCDSTDLRYILRDSDFPVASVAQGSPRANAFDPRGFWRVDRDKDPELRHTVLTLIAFHDLESKIQAAGGDRKQGIEAFLAQNDGEGWLLPETLRLADYGLGHDERARQPQPVASRLGPRFYDWQLAQSTDESWRECHLHARNLLGKHDYALRIVDLIERRMADGEDYLAFLADRFTRDLTGDDGYLTALVEIRAREILYESAWWTMVTDLRNGRHLDDNAYNKLLDRLHARKLLDDVGYRRRQGRRGSAPADGFPAQRAAESRADYKADPPPKKGQQDLFE